MHALVFHEKYKANQPFPHVVIDGAFDLALLQQAEQEIIGFSDWDGEKSFFGSRMKRHCAAISRLPATVRRLIEHLNGPESLHNLEALTGVEGLIPDPYLYGGGIHSIRRGGFLKIHADFNWHQKLRLHRSLNLLLYVNSNWDAAWGGALELWDANMRAKVVEVEPIINRLVVFSTSDSSYHGHPDPSTAPSIGRETR